MFHIMWKTPLSENDLLRGLEESLCQSLPSSWRFRLDRQRRARSGDQPDALLTIEAPDGTSRTLVVEAKTGLPPARITQILQQAKRYTEGPVIIVSSFVSPTARRILKEQGASFADLAGNLRIALDLPSLVIDIKGADKSPWPDTRAIRSLKGPGASRVVRALVDFRTPFNLSRLADLAQASSGTVYRVLEFLEAESLLERERRGAITEVDWRNLLRRWAQDYSIIDSNVTRNYLAPRGVLDVVERASRWNGRWALTGPLAAAQVLVSAPSRLAIVYVDDIAEAASQLDLRMVDSGANAILVEPFDEVVFSRTRKTDDIVYVAPSQAVVDLMTAPGRSPVEAEEMLEWMANNESEWRLRA